MTFCLPLVKSAGGKSQALKAGDVCARALLPLLFAEIIPSSADTHWV